MLRIVSRFIKEMGSEQFSRYKCFRKIALTPLWFEFGNVEPFLLLPALESQLGELDAFGAFEQSPAERAFARDVLEEELPLHFEGVVVALVGHFFPSLEKIDRLRDVGVPHRLRRLGIGLRQAAPQSRDCTALGAIDLDGEEIVASHAHVPGGVEMS